jgi:hypothetical protein
MQSEPEVKMGSIGRQVFASFKRDKKGKKSR